VAERLYIPLNQWKCLNPALLLFCNQHRQIIEQILTFAAVPLPVEPELKASIPGNPLVLKGWLKQKAYQRDIVSPRVSRLAGSPSHDLKIKDFQTSLFTKCFLYKQTYPRPFRQSHGYGFFRQFLLKPISPGEGIKTSSEHDCTFISNKPGKEKARSPTGKKLRRLTSQRASKGPSQGNPGRCANAKATLPAYCDKRHVLKSIHHGRFHFRLMLLLLPRSRNYGCVKKCRGALDCYEKAFRRHDRYVALAPRTRSALQTTGARN
jgi:hypothetical protein